MTATALWTGRRAAPNVFDKEEAMLTAHSRAPARRDLRCLASPRGSELRFSRRVLAQERATQWEGPASDPIVEGKPLRRLPK